MFFKKTFKFFFLAIIFFIFACSLYLDKTNLNKTNLSKTNKTACKQPAKINKFQTPASPPITPTISPPAVLSKRKSAAVPGRQTYSIMTAHRSPNFTKAIIDPEDVKVGQRQTMTVYVSDDKASITEVIAEIETDNGIFKQPLTFKSGTNRDGVWEGSWIVKDTHDTTYVTVFKAKNTVGESGEARISWTDPGCSCTGQACTVSTTCTVSGVDGADGGTLTISGGGITVASAATLIAGALVVSGGYLVKNDDSGIVNILSTNTICMTDADSDNYPANTTQIANCTSGRRRYLMTSITSTDCYDVLTGVNIGCDGTTKDKGACAYPGQDEWFTVNRGDSSFDYNCDTSETKEFNNMGNNDCCCDGNCVFTGSTGWDSQVVGSPPACGVQTNYVDGSGCHMTGGDDPTCTGSPTPLKYQECH